MQSWILPSPSKKAKCKVGPLESNIFLSGIQAMERKRKVSSVKMKEPLSVLLMQMIKVDASQEPPIQVSTYGKETHAKT